MSLLLTRKPIFTKAVQIFAYELILKDDSEVKFLRNATNNTLYLTLNSYNKDLNVSIEEFTNGKKNIISIENTDYIEKIADFSPNNFIAKVKFNSEKANDLLLALNSLKSKGFTIILDNLTLKDIDEPILNFVDGITIDSLKNSTEEQQKIIKEFSDYEVFFVVLNINTQDEKNKIQNLNYDYISGDFYKTPELKSRNDIPTNKYIYLNILTEVNNPDAKYKEIEIFIKKDLGLTYKLLKFVNSAFFGFVKKINSIKHGLVMLGLNEIKKWISLIALNEMGEDKTKELIVIALIRARTCEELADLLNLSDKKFDLFIVGMFSVLDSLIDRDMTLILSKMTLPKETKNALLGENNDLSKILNIVLSFENGHWEILNKSLKKMNISEEKITEIYYNAVKWTNKIFTL